MLLHSSTSSIDTKDIVAYPVLLLTQQSDSHHFNERRIVLNDTIKIGRSVARARPCESNAVFDCKVLSRNHAIFWFENDKVWLKDTKSSNGTFVNSQLLSRGTEDSEPREIYSGDIIQFGVEVVENTTTHGCIIAQTTIFQSDGKELRRFSDMSGAPNGNIPISNYYEEQIYQLAQYIQEASHREQTLEKKLNSLSQLIIDTQEASDSSWNVILNQDRLMEKLGLLQEQVDMYSKVDDHECLTVELQRVLEQRYGLEKESKSLLEGLIEEKSEVLQRVVDLEQSLTASEFECMQLRTTLESLQSEHGKISERLSLGKDEIENLQNKLKDAQSVYNSEISRLCSEKEVLVTRYEQLCVEAEGLRGKLKDAENELTRCDKTSLISLDGNNQYMWRLREKLSMTEIEICNCKEMIQQSTDRQSYLDSSVVGIQNQLSNALVSEIIALHNLSELDATIFDSDQSLNNFIIGTTSDLGLHFIESHQQIRNGTELIILMKEELLRLHKVAQDEKVIIGEGYGVEGSLHEMECLLEKMEGSQSRTKTLLAQIPERLLMMTSTENNIATYNASEKENTRTNISDCAVQTDSEIPCSGNIMETCSKQVDFLSIYLPNNIDDLNDNIKNLKNEKKLNESLKMELLCLQNENKQLVKKSTDLSIIVDEFKSTNSTKEDIDTQCELNEEYIQLYKERQYLQNKVFEFEEEMTKKQHEYDKLFEQYEQLIARQRSSISEGYETARIHDLEDICLRQQSEIEKMQVTLTNNYKTILARSRKISALSMIPLCLFLFAVIFAILSVLSRPWTLSSLAES